jgi:hypothetical protein
MKTADFGEETNLESGSQKQNVLSGTSGFVHFISIM